MGLIVMDLFEYGRQKHLEKEAPLAVRIRPRSLDEFVGQEHIIGRGKLLRRAIQADRLTSLIFYGPPGTGKTTLGEVIANSTSANFIKVNAVTAGVSKIREIIDYAKKQLGMYRKKTIVFIDEIHRFNKAQQDALLPDVESGTITLIGATTENPYFEVNSPLLSRSRVFRLHPLTKENIIKIVQRAVSDKERGLGNHNVHISSKALGFLAQASGGDARIALNAVEVAVLTTEADSEGIKTIDEKIIEDCIQQRLISYDKTGDNHYDVVSAFIKSIRGSDPNAALHWLARMLEAGEDIKFICRRMIILASEDIGLADSNALNVAVSASQAVEFVGLPEAQLILAHAVIYLASAPKSNSVIKAIDAALSDVRRKNIGNVPLHLRDSHYPGAGNLGHGEGYLYPHNYKSNFVEQEYLPKELQGAVYYHPTSNGMEKEIEHKINMRTKKEKSE